MKLQIISKREDTTRRTLRVFGEMALPESNQGTDKQAPIQMHGERSPSYRTWGVKRRKYAAYFEQRLLPDVVSSED